MTRKFKYSVVMISVVFGLAVLGWIALPGFEPSYRGKALSTWAKQYGENYWSGKDRAASKAAEAAIQQIGTNAIPYLLDRMRTKDPVIKQKLRRIFPQKWHAGLHLKDTSSEIRRIGAHGLAALGTNAPAAVPALIKIASHHPDEDGRYLAVFALRTLGPASEPAIPFLIQCLTNQAMIIRDDAAIGLGAIGRQPEISVPALTQYLEFARSSSHRFELNDAIGALSRFGTNAKAATPILLELLNDQNQSIRQDVTNHLPRINPEAAIQVRIKFSE